MDASVPKLKGFRFELCKQSYGNPFAPLICDDNAHSLLHAMSYSFTISIYIQCTLTATRNVILIHYHTHCHPDALSYSLTNMCAIVLTHWHLGLRSRALLYSLSYSRTVTHTIALTHRHTHEMSRALTRSLSYSRTVTRADILTVILTHCHAH